MEISRSNANRSAWLWLRGVWVALLLATANITLSAQTVNKDTERLGMALEYFQSNKYHESLLIFQQLDKQYRLNPRFKAYIGLCYYQEWNYQKAVQYFNAALPYLEGLSPHELSVYYYAAGESYFQMERYDSAMTYFCKDAEVCYDKEKGDVYYRIGLCYMFQEKWQSASTSFSKSDYYYRKFRNTAELKSRLEQIAHMRQGCDKRSSIIINEERRTLLRKTTSSAFYREAFMPWNFNIPQSWNP